MRRTRVKFCGFTRAEDIATACALGVDAIGLVMTRRSRRFVDIAQAAALRDAVPPFVSVVALVMDDTAEWVREVISRVRPDLLQFHGQEPADFCRAFDRRYLKAVPMASTASVHDYVSDYADADAFLLDSHAAGGQGGSGERFDWQRVPRDIAQRVLLAGGLTCDNVGDAVRIADPYGVDVSSGIELSPGIKDAERMRQFMQELGASGAPKEP